MALRLQFTLILKNDATSVTLGTSTANQRIERFWGSLRQMKSDFWMHHFKRELKEIMEMWNNHIIRQQKLGDTIPDVLFHEPEIVGASKYLYAVPENMSNSLLRLVRNDYLQIDGEFMKLASSIIEIYELPSRDELTDWTTARHLYKFLSEIISYLFTVPVLI